MEEKELRIDLAQQLSNLNEQRKSLTADCVERALDGLANRGELDKVLVLLDRDMHESVAGIVAGRIRDSFHRPCVMLTCGENSIKGSGRSIENYDLFSALYAHRHLFTRFGGHAMAAGLSLPEENISALRDGLNKDCMLTEDDFHETWQIDREVNAGDVCLSLAEELELLAPFGKVCVLWVGDRACP
jgi:single-stranded-DNA-specific exonuclease